MLDFIKDHSGPVLFAVALFIVAFILGIMSKSNGDGIFITLEYPGGNFSLGEPTLKIADIDLARIGGEDSVLLVAKLGDLSVTNQISEQLREMVKDSKGPFAKRPVHMKLHVMSKPNYKVSGPVAMACRNTPIFDRPVLAYGINTNTGTPSEVEGMLKLHPVWEVSDQLSNCSSDNDDVYDVWVSKQHVEGWIVGSIGEQESTLLVDANVVASSFH